MSAHAPAHGGLVATELDALDLAPADVLDVSVNVNPYGPCAVVRDAIAGADLRRYPDPSATPARRALAAWLQVGEARVAVGNGAVDLLWTLARALLRPGDGVLTVEPAFSELRSAAKRVGARIFEHRLVPPDFTLDTLALHDDLARLRPRLLYLCSPSNPVGRCTSSGAIADLAGLHPETTFVIDLSFQSLSTRHDETPWRGAGRVVWVRSLTKDHSLAGLRIGCAVAPPELVRRLEDERPPWSVNALAQAAAVAMTSDAADHFVQESRQALLRDRADLERELRPLPLDIQPSDTIFVLAGLRGGRRASDLRAALLKKHCLLVRDCTSFGLPHHIRIGARPPAERARLLAALTRELA